MQPTPERGNTAVYFAVLGMGVRNEFESWRTLNPWKSCQPSEIHFVFGVEEETETIDRMRY